MAVVTAASQGLVGCQSCGQVSAAVMAGADSCPRCGVRLRTRRADSLARTTALLAAAAMLLVPANLLPVMTTLSLTGPESETIMSGVLSLWRAGSWALAVIVFTASILVPVLKILALALLVTTTTMRSSWRMRERTVLHRLLEHVGRWSMLDVFVMGVLAALVHSPQAGVDIEPGAVAFAAVVVLTTTASRNFDARLIWDRGGDRRE